MKLISNKETPFTDSRNDSGYIWFFILSNLHLREEINLTDYIKKHQSITRDIIFLLRVKQKTIISSLTVSIITTNHHWIHFTQLMVLMRRKHQAIIAQFVKLDINQPLQVQVHNMSATVYYVMNPY